MSLIRYTNTVAGARVEKDSGKTAGLIVKDRLAWVMVYPHFKQPIIAPSTSDVVNGKVVEGKGAEEIPESYETNLVVFVDANEDTYIEALTMG